MFQLPLSIQRIIYTYDPTYHRLMMARIHTHIRQLVGIHEMAFLYKPLHSHIICRLSARTSTTHYFIVEKYPLRATAFGRTHNIQHWELR